MRRIVTFLPVLMLAASITAPGANAASNVTSEGRVLPYGCTPLAGAATTVRMEREAANVDVNGSTVVGPAAFQSTEPVVAGETLICTVTVRNRRAQTTTYDLVAAGVVGSDDDGGVAFITADDERADLTAVSWVRPVVEEITLPSLGVARIPVRLVTPRQLPPGAAFATLDVIPRVPLSAEGDGARVGIESRLQITFLLQTSADGTPRLELRDEQAPRLRWNRDSWSTRAMLSNSGSGFARPEGRVRIRSIFGSTVATLPIQSRPLLPDASRPVVTTWKGVPWFGIYRTDTRVADAAGSGVATSSGWFIALPPWWMLALVAALIVGLIVWRRRSHVGSELDDEYADDDVATWTG